MDPDEDVLAPLVLAFVGIALEIVDQEKWFDLVATEDLVLEDLTIASKSGHFTHTLRNTLSRFGHGLKEIPTNELFLAVLEELRMGVAATQLDL